MPDYIIIVPQQPKLIGIAADHSGFELKLLLTAHLRGTGHTVVDFGNRIELTSDDAKKVDN
jgi:ribose 5-phosphate isomerase RpiB